MLYKDKLRNYRLYSYCDANGDVHSYALYMESTVRGFIELHLACLASIPMQPNAAESPQRRNPRQRVPSGHFLSSASPTPLCACHGAASMTTTTV